MQFKQRSRLLCLFKCVSEKHFYKYDIVTNEIHQAFQHNVSWRELTTINWSIHQDVLEKKETDNFRRKCKLSILKALKVHKKLSGSMMSTFHRDLFLFFSHLPKWILQMSGAMLLVSGSFVLGYFFFPLAPVFWMILPMCSLPNFWHPARKCIDVKYSPDLRYACGLVAYIFETAANRVDGWYNNIEMTWSFANMKSTCAETSGRQASASSKGWGLDDIGGCHVSPQSQERWKRYHFKRSIIRKMVGQILGLGALW